MIFINLMDTKNILYYDMCIFYLVTNYIKQI